MPHDVPSEAKRDKQSCRLKGPLPSDLWGGRITYYTELLENHITNWENQTMTSEKYAEMETLPNIQPLAEPTWKEKLLGWKTYWTTKEGWIGDYVSPPSLITEDSDRLGLYVLDHS
jgi:hypothetical protein